LNEARQNAPLGYTHQLEDGIIEVKEKDKNGKSVRQVVMDKTKNSIFQKPISPDGKGTRGGKKDTAYYPTSVEFGFHVSKEKKVPGQFFLHGSFKKNRAKSRKIIRTGLSKAIDKLTR
jgi:NifB/MoaA-like Fe-S oxidoreductase